MIVQFQIILGNLHHPIPRHFAQPILVHAAHTPQIPQRRLHLPRQLFNLAKDALLLLLLLMLLLPPPSAIAIVFVGGGSGLIIFRVVIIVISVVATAIIAAAR